MKVISGEWETSPLYTMQNALLEAGIADAGGVKVLSSATVPLVKLTDKSTDIKVMSVSLQNRICYDTYIFDLVFAMGFQLPFFNQIHDLGRLHIEKFSKW